MSGPSNPSSSGPVPLWIDGQEVTTQTTFDVESPNTSQKLWSSSSASIQEAQKACDAAQKAFPSWKKTKAADIQTILLKAADIMESRRAELLAYMKEETGALDGFCHFNISTTIDNFRAVSGLTSTISGAIPQTKTPGQGAFIFKEPYGVVLGIAPWNAPYILGVRAFLYPIAAGNTCVLKGSELSPKTFWAMGSILKEAGLPDGVLNIIYHRPKDAAAVTDALIEHPAIKKINFTGSTVVGSIIAAKAGKELKPCLMELGGKASAIVCEDANLQHAAFQVALGSFLHAGQICMATERVIVHRKIITPFAEALQTATAQVYAPEAPAPTLIAKAGVDKNRALHRDAVAKGATILYGDPAAAPDASPYRIRPVIVRDVTPAMDLWYTESFGPTLALLGVDSDDAAVALANDTEYGLSGAVFTESLARGLRIARAVDSGAVHINSMSVHDEAGLPHGGVKKSGWGRFNAQWGLEEFVKLKTVSYME